MLRLGLLQPRAGHSALQGTRLRVPALGRSGGTLVARLGAQGGTGPAPLSPAGSSYRGGDGAAGCQELNPVGAILCHLEEKNRKRENENSRLKMQTPVES